MLETHLRKLRKRDEISPAEEAAIRAAVAEVREVPADKVLVRRGQEIDESLMLLDGWIARTRDLADGRRQITELHVGGDFSDLHGFTLKRLDHNLVTLARSRIAVFPHENLRSMLEQFPHLARVYWLMTNIDAAIHREWSVSLGRRTALARMAHLFCELLVRLEVPGLADGTSYDFPLTQQELSECLGLTAVHVNRTLQELRRRGLITLEDRRLIILDRAALGKVAEFDPLYLYLERRPC
ncbi:MAG TPA: Crp/Fnr family transcriptional regulator [Sphingomicrobium sp.]|nr:Crp/Fnr family transcriptional regulator [Sphingomicrobium sp.]